LSGSLSFGSIKTHRRYTLTRVTHIVFSVYAPPRVSFSTGHDDEAYLIYYYYYIYVCACVCTLAVHSPHRPCRNAIHSQIRQKRTAASAGKTSLQLSPPPPRRVPPNAHTIIYNNIIYLYTHTHTYERARTHMRARKLTGLCGRTPPSHSTASGGRLSTPPQPRPPLSPKYKRRRRRASRDCVVVVVVVYIYIM